MQEEIFLESIKRMQLLKLSDDCIEAFIKHNKIYKSAAGSLYELDAKEKYIINKFEEKHKNHLVYHVIHNKFEFGECYSILYTSPYKEEWKNDKLDIEEGYVFAYVENVDFPYCSEFGSIYTKSKNGALVRLG